MPLALLGQKSAQVLRSGQVGMVCKAQVIVPESVSAVFDEMVQTVDEVVETIERWGKKGWIISICFGPAKDMGIIYSVTAMHPATGKEPKQPFGASKFGDIGMILDIELPLLIGAA